jgi:putative intracellular protease/amidase
LKPDALVFVGPRFAGAAVVELLCLLRRRGLTTGLISMTPGAVFCDCGVLFQPDTFLSQADSLLDERAQIVVLAGGATSAAQALVDPRLLVVMRRVLAAGGLLAALTGAYQPLQETGFLETVCMERTMRQANMDTAVFARQLAIAFQNGGKN